MAKELHKRKWSSLGKRSFRRWVKQLFTKWVKCQNSEAEEILILLQDIKESVEIIAREIALQSKQRGK